MTDIIAAAQSRRLGTLTASGGSRGKDDRHAIEAADRDCVRCARGIDHVVGVLSLGDPARRLE
ncbi:hypothetical protein GCM10023147_10500 [Tsukamurella soli]|uniref:Uncharacterized protein n=1 Tax=Tsukamurella soli TaxID=644556 RepID=A0ABP8J890_9ACTN